MADHFGAIAAGEIGCKRVPLVFPSPMAKNGVLLPLTETTHKTPSDVYKKPSTREEIDFEIEKLKTKYEPFMQRLAPIPAKTRESFLLDQFQKRAATEEDLYDFSRVLGGEGERVAITVRQLLRFTMLAITIDRADSVDDELRRQLEARRDTRLARRTANARTHLGHFKTRFVKLVASRAVDRTVYSAAAKHHLIRRVDNDINRERRDIAFDNLDSHAYILP